MVFQYTSANLYVYLIIMTQRKKVTSSNLTGYSFTGLYTLDPRAYLLYLMMNLDSPREISAQSLYRPNTRKHGIWRRIQDLNG